jgi:excinuclease ABC subunit A
LHNKNIADILELTVDNAVAFFDEINELKISEKLKVLQKVGLGYIKLGQSSSTLSGGEAQRVKLAFFLSMKNKAKNGLFLFDEPTTGLHYDDIKKLINSLNEIIELGNTVIVIEHNLELIKVSDYNIDLGPFGGDKGGNLIFNGNTKELSKSESLTGKYLKNII